MKVQAKKKGLIVELLVKSVLPMETQSRVAEKIKTFFQRDSGASLLAEFADICPSYTSNGVASRVEHSTLEWPHVALDGVDVSFQAYIEKSIINGEDGATTIRGIVVMEHPLPYRGQTVLEVLPTRTKVGRLLTA